MQNNTMRNTVLQACCGFVLIVSVFPVSIHAQRSSSRSRLPEIGSELPAIKIFDDEGQVFNTSSLKGSYTVLVFGCLT